jgi:hypothetical protein
MTRPRVTLDLAGYEALRRASGTVIGYTSSRVLGGLDHRESCRTCADRGTVQGRPCIDCSDDA